MPAKLRKFVARTPGPRAWPPGPARVPLDPLLSTRSEPLSPAALQNFEIRGADGEAAGGIERLQFQPVEAGSQRLNRQAQAGRHYGTARLHEIIHYHAAGILLHIRSEDRRVGKECRFRW